MTAKDVQAVAKKYLNDDYILADPNARSEVIIKS
jgi:hypothetical protein